MIEYHGIYKFSLIDYPGKICGILFTGNCNFRCPFCHNPCLVFDPESQPAVPQAEVTKFLRTRRGLLDGVVISGGEPTLQNGLPDAIREIRTLGFLVKLDTNGSHPDVVEALLGEQLIQAAGIDYKAPADGYDAACGIPGHPELHGNVLRSIRLCLNAGIELDVRTTVHRRLLSEAQLSVMAETLRTLGVPRWTLQQYHPVEVIDDTLSAEPTYSDGELTAIARKLSLPDSAFRVQVRGLTGHLLD